MTRTGDIERILKRARHEGFRLEDRGSKWVVYPPDPGLEAFVVHKPHKKSGSITKILTELKRRGFKG